VAVILLEALAAAVALPGHLRINPAYSEQIQVCCHYSGHFAGAQYILRGHSPVYPYSDTRLSQGGYFSEKIRREYKTLCTPVYGIF